MTGDCSLPLYGEFLHLFASKHRSSERDLVDIHVACKHRTRSSISSDDVDHTYEELSVLCSVDKTRTVYLEEIQLL
jgi:hypothetical protein